MNHFLSMLGVEEMFISFYKHCKCFYKILIKVKSSISRSSYYWIVNIHKHYFRSQLRQFF